ncbi:hypothetical protein [Pannonibacter indicus]|uniref:hypothetical protein n=1 Tax=Pannonibacter indicus TaxID=466044 RepID=UPI00391A65E9
MKRDIYQALISDAAQGRAAMSGILLFAAGLAACGSRRDGEAVPGCQVFNAAGACRTAVPDAKIATFGCYYKNLQ